MATRKRTIPTPNPPKKSGRRERTTPTFAKFSPNEFEKWTQLPRTRMMEEILRRNGVKNYAFKTKKSLIPRMEPVKIMARGRVGYSGSYHFYLKAGNKRLPLHRRVDVPHDSNKVWIEILNWRDSKFLSEIRQAILDVRKPWFAMFVKRRGGSPTPIIRWFYASLEAAGFETSDLKKILMQEVGPERLSALLLEHFSYSEKEARGFLRGFGPEHYFKLTEEQKELLDKGHLARVFPV
jgi:hypothetical protein